MAAGNYTVTNNVVELMASVQDAASKNVSYTCRQPSLAYNSTETLQNATDDVPGWIPLIVIAVIGAMLLGLVAMFRKN